jgi:Glycosyltransferase (GlcNAc)
MGRDDTVFLNIASYCDPLLGFTIGSALAQARHPGRLRFGVVNQAPREAAPALPAGAAANQLRSVQIDPLDARGPCWARAIGMSLYQGETWYLQVDSHTWFEPGWDERLIDWGRRCAGVNPRCLLTCYPNPFHLVDGQPVAERITEQVLVHVVKMDSHFGAEHPVLMFEGVPVQADDAVAGLHVAAGCLFAPGQVVQALPYDPFLYFHGEEQAFALRAWTHGWDIFHIPGMPLLHLYNRPGAPDRPLHWQPEHDAQRAQRSADLDRAAQRRLRALLWDAADLGVYGLGHERTLADYAAYSGIDYTARTIEPRARKTRYGY